MSGFLVATGTAGLAFAQTGTSSSDPIRFVRWIGQDATALGRGVVSRRALYAAAGMGVLLVGLSPVDSLLTQRSVEAAEGLPPTLRRGTNELGNVRAVRPMALALFLGSMLSRNERFQDAAYTSAEAIVLANLVTSTIKTVVGRARPSENRGAGTYRPFGGSLSFPSGHATTVFAFTTPWLLYYPGYPTAILFALGAGTSFIRMAERAHWLSDVIAGTAIGFATGYWLSYRHQRGTPAVSVAPVVSASEVGLALRVML